ncbi:MAG: ABC transporter permease [Acetobacteraceae bacterium]
MRGFGSATAFRRGVSIVALAFFALFLLYPLWLVLHTSFLDQGTHQLGLANYAQILASRYYLQSAENSLLASALTTALTVLIAVPMGFCVARVAIPGKQTLMTIAALPLVLPTFVSGYALLVLLGRVGVITVALRSAGIPMPPIYGMSAIVIVFTSTLYPFVLLPTVAGFRAINASLEESARNLGGSRWRVFWTVLLPLVMPAVLGGSFLVFIESLEDFGVPAIVTQGLPFISLDIFNLFAGAAESNVGVASALSVLLLIVTSWMLLLQRRYLGRRRFATSARRPASPIELGWAGRTVAAVFCWGVVIASIFPFVAVVVISFMQFKGPVLHWRPGLQNYGALFGQSFQPLYSTLALATAAALAATALGAPVGYVLVRYRSRLSGLLDVVSMAPFAVSGTVLAIGLVIAFNSGWLVLTGGWLILVISYVVRKVPFSIRASSAIVHQIDPSLEEASINLGVSPVRTFAKLTMPLMVGGLVAGMVLVWVTVASEISSTIVLYSARWRTMTVVMFQTVQGTSAGEGTAAAAVLVLVTAIPLFLIYRLLGRRDVALL